MFSFIHSNRRYYMLCLLLQLQLYNGAAFYQRFRDSGSKDSTTYAAGSLTNAELNP